MRRRDFIASIGAVSVLPRAVWSNQMTSEGASDPASADNIPLSYDDARFSDNAASNALRLASDGIVTNKSITQTGRVVSHRL